MFNVKMKSAVTMAIAVAALPSAAAAAPTTGEGSESNATPTSVQDLRSADALDSSIRAESREAPVADTRDLRSADALDSSIRAESRQAPVADTRDLRSPDARDAAAGRGTFSAPEVTVVRVSEPSPASGLDWGDAGIGAGGVLGLILVGLGGSLLFVHRRHRHAPSI